ncbi:MAG: glutaredoxin family protein, partial [Acidobacteriota bacterium]
MPRPTLFRSIDSRVPWTLILCLAAVLSAAAPATADWLVTETGERIETAGPWQVRGRLVVFEDPSGALRSMRLSNLDMEASEIATRDAQAPPADAAVEDGNDAPERPAAPKPVMVLTNADIPQAGAAAAEDANLPPEIILYSTSWCGFCRKARTLLTELGADFVEKDIEKNPEARREHAAKAGPSAGVPVLDIDGRIIRGYSESAIRQEVEEVLAEQRQQEGDGEAEGTESRGGDVADYADADLEQGL